MARRLAFVAALVAVLLPVSGAGGAPAQTPKRGGTLVLGAPASPAFREPACLNPLLPTCTGLTLTLWPKVLEGAFDVGPDLTWRARLVSHVEYARQPPFTLTYHIHPEARWSDGVPISARDFVFTHSAIRRYGAADDWHRTKIRSVLAIGARSIRVVLRSRVAGWQALFPVVLPRHALEGEDLAKVWIDRIDNPKTRAPIGSGPFLVSGFERGERLTLVRNRGYWRRQPAHLDRLDFRMGVMSQDLVELFRTGVLDLAWGLPPGDAPVLRQERGLTVVTSPGSNLDLFWMRKGPGGHPALRIKLVRQALAYGIDRATLVRQLLSVSDPRQRVVDSAVFATSSPYFEPNWRAYRYQPSRARRLLGRAGCTRGSDGIYSCSGQRLRLRFVTTGIAGGYRLRLLDLVPAQLQQVGVEVVSTQTTAQAYFGQLLPSGAFDLALHSIPLGPIPLGKLFFGCGEPLNPTDYCQRLVTSDLDQAERILDATQRAHVLNRADARLARDVPALPFVQMPQSAAHGRHLRNFDLSVNAQLNFLWNAEDWWLDD